MGHGCHIGDPEREGVYRDCLHVDDHAGPPYTLALRVERGFGDKFRCDTKTGPTKRCGHTATDHVSEDKRATLTGCFKCGCAHWTEPPHEKESEFEMGPDAPVIENENGAKQSAIPAVFTTMPLRALWELAKLQKYGDEKYGPHNWRGIPEQDHVNHAFAHLMADQMGDITDDHLLHATWRLMAALEDRLSKGLANE